MEYPLTGIVVCAATEYVYALALCKYFFFLLFTTDAGVRGR